MTYEKRVWNGALDADAVTRKIEFGSIPIGTRFRIDSNGVVFEKTSGREAKIVAGNVRLIGVPSQLGRQKLVQVVF